LRRLLLNTAHMSADQFIAARVSTETKARLRAVAAREHLSESAFLKRLIDRALPPASDADALAPADDLAPRDARLSIRLRPDDVLLLRARAEGRGMAPSTYVSVLLRAHLRSVTPLPREELLALRGAIAELGAFGRLLDRTAPGADGGLSDVSQRRLLGTMLQICSALRDHFKALVLANARSWARGYSDEGK
jgi:hypothetical protein